MFIIVIISKPAQLYYFTHKQPLVTLCCRNALMRSHSLYFVTKDTRDVLKNATETHATRRENIIVLNFLNIIAHNALQK